MRKICKLYLRKDHLYLTTKVKPKRGDRVWAFNHNEYLNATAHLNIRDPYFEPGVVESTWKSLTSAFGPSIYVCNVRFNSKQLGMNMPEEEIEVIILEGTPLAKKLSAKMIDSILNDNHHICYIDTDTTEIYLNPDESEKPHPEESMVLKEEPSDESIHALYESDQYRPVTGEWGWG